MTTKKISVVKFGGSLAGDEAARQKFFRELATLSKEEQVVLVHGGGPEINSWLERIGIESKFVNGMRYTDGRTLEIVEMVLSGKVNKGIVSELNKRGAPAVGISGKDGQMAICGQLSELGYVGEPMKIHTKILLALLHEGYLPVVSSLGMDNKGQTLNVNADSMAMAIAAALSADRLILLTDVPGVLDAKKSTIPVIEACDVEDLLSSGVITGGMIPKIKACAASVKSGIKEVWIADGKAGLRDLRGTVIK